MSAVGVLRNLISKIAVALRPYYRKKVSKQSKSERDERFYNGGLKIAIKWNIKTSRK